MIQIIKNIVKRIIRLLPLRNVIVFESAPDLSDNTKAVFDEMVKRNINIKYKFVWLCYDPILKQYPKIKNAYYFDVNKSKLRFFFLIHTSKVFICCNRFIGGRRNGQMSFFLTHGSPIKNTNNYYKCPDFINYILTASTYMNEKCAISMSVPLDKCHAFGFPRNDDLINKRISLALLFGKFKKYIVWYPTVKQFKSGEDYGIKPIQYIDNVYEIETINSYAKKYDELIVVKPHFAQIANIPVKNLSNIVFINDDFFKKNSITSYQFLGSFDALITDYSSVFYDFMLTDKQICLIWNDLEDFKTNVGLVDFYEEVTKGCFKAYSFAEFLAFLRNVGTNVDLEKASRNQTCALVNEYSDGNSSKRVCDFIIEKCSKQ